MDPQSSTFNPYDENIGRYFWCSTRLAAGVLKEIFLIIYNTKNTQYGHKPLGQFLSEHCVSYNNIIHSNKEHQKLWRDPADAYFDVSFLSKILSTMLVRCGIYVPPAVQHVAREIQVKRNRVCHEDVSMNDSALSAAFADYQRLFTMGLEEAGRSTGQDVSAKVRNVTQQLEEALTRSLPKDLDMLTAVQSFRYSRQGSATTETRSRLMAGIKSSPDILSSPQHVPVLRKGSRQISLCKLLVAGVQAQVSAAPMVIILWGQDQEKNASVLTFLVVEWANKNQEITALDTFDLAVLINGSENKGRSLSNCVHKHVSFTMENIALMSKMKVLFLLDSPQPSDKLLADILLTFPAGHVIVATTPENRFSYERTAHLVQRPMLTLQVAADLV